MILSWSCKGCGDTFYIEDYKDNAEGLSEDMKDHKENPFGGEKRLPKSMMRPIPRTNLKRGNAIKGYLMYRLNR